MITKDFFTFAKKSVGTFPLYLESLPGYTYQGPLKVWKQQIHFLKTEWLGSPAEKATPGGFSSYSSRYVRRQGKRMLRYIDTNTY